MVMPKAERVEKHCEYCDTRFWSLPSQHRRFCTRDCAYKARHKALADIGDTWNEDWFAELAVLGPRMDVETIKIGAWEIRA